LKKITTNIGDIKMENLNADKKVLVTGASGGIGRAIAVEAAKAGYYVICHYNGNQAKAEETLSIIKENGGEGELIKFDVSDRADCKAKLDEMTAKHGVLWGVVNNAGITRDNTFAARPVGASSMHLVPISAKTSTKADMRVVFPVPA
jgi:3-oxoacyl-[acyl-carrier protein] reductase